tara:strand:+ start:689 stop:994 length:306 start_codon:yes stop_codon:yes gene_type:complete
MIDRIKKNYFLLISTFLLLYFFFNLLDGERGFVSNIKKKNLLIDLKKQEIELKNNIEDLQYKNLLLTDNLDLDFIETIIRKKFIFGKKNETIYIIKESNEN